MKKQTQFVIFSLVFLLWGCGPKVNLCVIDDPISLAHCHNLSSDLKYDQPLTSMEPIGPNKWSCMSPDDFAEFLRGNAQNISLCTIVSVARDQVYCSTPVGGLSTDIKSIHKFSCFITDDLARLTRYIANKKTKPHG
jgi:hypothetical protein